MQMVKNIFIVLFLGWLVFLVFMPKEELYYKLEQELSKSDIVINEKRLEGGIFSLTLYDSDVYVKGVKLATVEKVSFFTLLLYTKITLENVQLDELLKTMLPTEITYAKATNGVWNPLISRIDAEGSFGGLEGDLYLDKKFLRLDFNDSANIGSLKPKLQEDEKGWYYETSF